MVGRWKRLLQDGGAAATMQADDGDLLEVRALHPVDRLERLIPFVEVLRDSLDLAGRDFNPHLGRYVAVCDYIGEELGEGVMHLSSSN
jgi:hypothetical protein